MEKEIQNFIISILSLGIITAFIELILPAGKNKKYIYILIGLLAIVTVLSPIINLITNFEFEYDFTSMLQSIDTRQTLNSIDSTDLIKNQFIYTLKEDIDVKLKDKKVLVNEIDILVDEEYNIKKIYIEIAKTESIANINEVVEYINTEYDISYSSIEVVEKGE